jgi:hypothetical protein
MTDRPPGQFKKPVCLSRKLRIVYRDLGFAGASRYLHLRTSSPASSRDVATDVTCTTRDGVRMVLTFDAMHDATWTERATMGWETELEKLRAVAAAQRS